jgi:hypothetical protein
MYTKSPRSNRDIFFHFHSPQEVIMKKIIAIVLALASHVALAGQHCDVWEYARLKDSTKEDLTAHACASSKAAKDNRDEKYTLIGNLAANSLALADHVVQAEAVCRDQVKVTQSVFQQKFGKALSVDECQAK